MNTRGQAIVIAHRINNLIDLNQGLVTLTFFDNTTVQVRILRINSSHELNNFTASIQTFTNNIGVVTTYDVYIIRGVN